jgi:hypothetical protein
MNDLLGTFSDQARGRAGDSGHDRRFHHRITEDEGTGWSNAGGGEDRDGKGQRPLGELASAGDLRPGTRWGALASGQHAPD